MTDLIINVRGCDSFYVAADDLTITDDEGTEYAIASASERKPVDDEEEMAFLRGAAAGMSEALDAEKALCDKVFDVLSRMVVGWEHIIGADLAQHPDVVAVAAEWRAARGR